MDLPLISIVMCTYNGEAFLEAQINSLINQTYPNLEIIISDDASADNTRTILSRYADNPIIKLFFQENNLGFVANFEFAISKASGNFIALCDQDDVWLPEKITELYEHLPADCLLIYSNSLLIDDNGTSLHKTLADLREMYSGNDTRYFAFYNIVPGHAAMIKRALLQYALPLPSIAFHDWWLAAVATIYGKICYHDKVLNHYRQHANTVTKNIKPKKIPSRSRSNRYDKYITQLCYLERIYGLVKPEHTAFFSRLYSLYKAKANKEYNFALFLFLYKYQHVIYRFTRKNFMSRLTDMRKLARHEKPD
jgi:glycosyltransferase involved in cell wall biosynthesis